jgi:hypothetical protein
MLWTRSRRARGAAIFLEIERLYRLGFTLRQIGERVDPPVTSQRAGQLLRQGARLGLYLIPEMHNERLRRTEQRLTVLEVRSALMATQRKDQAAKMLGISKAALESRFGHVVRGVREERRKERLRRAIAEEYRALSLRLGSPAGTTCAPTRRSLRRRTAGRRGLR